MGNEWVDRSRPERRLLVLGLVLALAGSLALALDPKKDIDQYLIDHFTTGDGLPQSSVVSIVQSEDGYLWMGTYEGLARFDGIQFTVFDKSNVLQMTNNSIKALYQDRQHNLWIGTTNELLCYRDGAFTRWTTANGLSSNSILSIADDASGTVWVGTTEGLNRLQNNLITRYTSHDGLPHQHVSALADDGAGGLWIGTGGAGIARWKDGRFQLLPISRELPSGDVRVLYLDRQRRMWIGTSGGGLGCFDGQTLRQYGLKDGLSNNDVRSIFQDTLGTVWIGTNGGGLNCLRSGRFSSLTAQSGVMDDSVRAIVEDREGSLWVGSRHGLFRLKDDKFVIYGVRHGLPVDEIRCVFEDRQKRLWIGTMGGGLVCRAKGNFTTYGMAAGLRSNQIWCIAQSQDGSIWFGTYGGGLHRWREGRVQVFTTSEGLANNIIRAIYVDDEDNVWVGTNGGGVDVLRQGRVVRHYSRREGLSDDFIYAIKGDRQGSVWIGTYSGGINRIQNGKITVYGPQQDVSPNAVWAIQPDSDGSVWFGTNDGGLLLYRQDRFTTFTVRDGLYSDLAFQILDDGLGNLWMNCNKGIFRVAKQELIEYAAKRIHRLECATFGRSEGLQTIECGGPAQPAGWRGNDGKLWFPTIKGLVMFDLVNTPINSVWPPVVIERVVINNLAYPAGDPIVVPPGPGNIEIHYAGLSFMLPNKVFFRYKLEGFDADWIEAGNRRAAYYTNLSPGRYTFRVTACNNDNLWNSSGARVRFSLEPHFYQAAWFYITGALALALGGFAFYRLRVRHLERRKQELEQLVAERTHQLDEANNKLQQLVIIDDLTGIANHRRFAEFYDMEWRRALRSSRSLSLIMIDVDHFKEFNDYYGHQTGDYCLLRIAHTLSRVVNRPGDMVARYGGEEFVVVLSETNSQGAMEIAGRLRAEVKKLAIPHSQTTPSNFVTISLGCASITPRPTDNPAVLIDQADKAMYRAKQEGRDRTCAY